MSIILNQEDYDFLNAIAKKTKQDCWFHIEQIEGGDYVHDLENDMKISLKLGVYDLVESVYQDCEDLLSFEDMKHLVLVLSNLLLD